MFEDMSYRAAYVIPFSHGKTAGRTTGLKRLSVEQEDNITGGLKRVPFLGEDENDFPWRRVN